MIRRAIGLVAALLLLAALLVTFLPTSPSGATCGTWVSPEWSQSKVEHLLKESGATAKQAQAMADGGNAQAAGIVSQLEGVALAATRSYAVCSDSLSTRRTWSLVLLSLAILVPLGAIFVGGGWDRRGRRTATA